MLAQQSSGVWRGVPPAKKNACDKTYYFSWGGAALIDVTITQNCNTPSPTHQH